MKIAIGADEKNVVTALVIRAVAAAGHEPQLFGPLADVPRNWARVAREVAEAVAAGAADEGILFCWTGTGVSLAANKVPGVRAALCADAETARGARLWNDANILCLSLRLTSETVAGEILASWLETAYRPNQEDDFCLRQVRELEAHYTRR